MTHPFITDAEATQKIQQSYSQLESQIDGIASGYRGAISIADTPTEDGIYTPTEAGTYPNAGGLEYLPEGVDEGLMVQFIKTGSEWVKNSYPLPVQDLTKEFSTVGLNVSELFPTGGVNGSYRYDLEGAILKVQDEYGDKEGFPWGGIAISFIDVSTRKAVCYINNESDGTFYPERFSNINNWRFVDINKGSQVYEDLGATAADGKYIALNYSVGTVVDLTPIDEVNGHSHLRYTVLINMPSAEGDMFELRAFNELDAKRVYAFLDSDNKILEVAGRYEFTNDTKIIVAPKDTARVIFNLQRNVEGSYIYKVIDPKIKEQNSQILSVKNEQEANHKDVNDKLIKNSATVSLNLTESYPDKGLDGGRFYNLEHAIDVVKQELGSEDGFPWAGMKISFENNVTRKLQTYINQESDTIEGFDDIDNWRFVDINKGSQHYLDIGQTGVEGKFIPLNFTVGTVVDLTPQDSSYAHSHEEYTVLIDANAQEGDMFELRSWNDRDAHRVYAFLDSDNKILEVATRYFYVEDTHLLVAPKNTSRVIFNFKRNINGSYIYKVIDPKFNHLASKIDEAAKQDSHITNDILNGDFSDGLANWIPNRATGSAEEGVATITCDDIDAAFGLNQNYPANTFVVGNHYYISYHINPDITHKPVVRIRATNRSLTDAVAGQFTKISEIEVLGTPSNSINFYGNGRSVDGLEIGTQVRFKDIMLINLTRLFGEGNEPTKEQFENLLDLLPYDWFEGSVPLADWQLALTRLIIKGGVPSGDGDDDAFALRVTSLMFKKKVDTEWIKATGTAMLVPDSDRVVHTVELTELEEDTEYEFKLLDVSVPCVYTTLNGDPSESVVIHWHTFQPMPNGNYRNEYSSDIKQFKTFPRTLVGSMRFGTASDTHGAGEEAFIDMGTRNVRVIIHSGDIATGNGGASNVTTWYTFFNCLNKAVDTDGNIIPIIPTMGNHEVWQGSSGSQWGDGSVGVKPNFATGKRGDAEWYYCFFPTYLIGYKVAHFGNYASIFSLDPGITTRIDGEQLQWIKDNLRDREDVPHKIFTFHYSPFPNGRRNIASYNNGVRSVWCPVIEPYKPLVFNGHDHVTGRTVPILSNGGNTIMDGIEDPDGVVYLTTLTASSSGPQAGRNPNTKWWLHSARASVWGYFDFEQNPASLEYRLPDAADGTEFPSNEVLGWWEVEIENDKRTMRFHNYNGEISDEFVQDSTYLGV